MDKKGQEGMRQEGKGTRKGCTERDRTEKKGTAGDGTERKGEKQE